MARKAKKDLSKIGLETTEERWSRWDKLLNENKYTEVISEFDSSFNKKEQLLIGDLVRREQALEALGVISFNKEKVKYESRKRKY
jgi:hypothetical protein